MKAMKMEIAELEARGYQPSPIMQNVLPVPYSQENYAPAVYQPAQV